MPKRKSRKSTHKFNPNEIDFYFKRHKTGQKTVGQVIRESYLNGYSITTLAKTYHTNKYQIRKLVKNLDRYSHIEGQNQRRIELKERASQRLDYYKNKRKAYLGELKRQNAGFRQAHDPTNYSGSYWFMSHGGSGFEPVNEESKTEEKPNPLDRLTQLEKPIDLDLEDIEA